MCIIKIQRLLLGAEKEVIDKINIEYLFNYQYVKIILNSHITLLGGEKGWEF